MTNSPLTLLGANYYTPPADLWKDSARCQARKSAQQKFGAPCEKRGFGGCCGNIIILLPEDDAKVCMELALVNLLVKETVSP